MHRMAKYTLAKTVEYHLVSDVPQFSKSLIKIDVRMAEWFSFITGEELKLKSGIREHPKKYLYMLLAFLMIFIYLDSKFHYSSLLRDFTWFQP